MTRSIKPDQTNASQIGPLIDEAMIAHAMEELAAADPDMERALAHSGLPPLRPSEPGFRTLVNAICSQQVSKASAAAILGRLEDAIHPFSPDRVMDFDEDSLRTLGLSRPKARYVMGMAQQIAVGTLRLDRLSTFDDETAIAELVKVKGIGRWTAEVYLLFALRRPDIWPVDDLAVVEAVRRLKGLSERPKREELYEIGQLWRPWRSVAARMMWHIYRTMPDV